MLQWYHDSYQDQSLFVEGISLITCWRNITGLAKLSSENHETFATNLWVCSCKTSPESHTRNTSLEPGPWVALRDLQSNLRCFWCEIRPQNSTSQTEATSPRAKLAGRGRWSFGRPSCMSRLQRCFCRIPNAFSKISFCTTENPSESCELGLSQLPKHISKVNIYRSAPKALMELKVNRTIEISPSQRWFSGVRLP